MISQIVLKKTSCFYVFDPTSYIFWYLCQLTHCWELPMETQENTPILLIK